MAVISSFIASVFKMIFIGIFAFAGIMTGKKLREKKNASAGEE